VSIQESETKNLAASYQQVRQFTRRITQSLSPEDCMVQSMEDASPIRWHLAHTTWFFETFILKDDPEYKEFDPLFSFLFNSYYNAVGDQFPRPQRGVISRPSLEGIFAYREYVDGELLKRLESKDFAVRTASTLEIGINHEQQHQELMLADLKHALAANPTLPVFEPNPFEPKASLSQKWIKVASGMHDIGHRSNEFCFDNELPRHQIFLPEFQVSSDLVTAGMFIEFIEDGGYERPDNWLSLGWSTVEKHGWNAPLYWVKKDEQWMQYTLAGLVPIDPDWPVCHISFFEADAFARWNDARLPTEFEWEVACQSASNSKNESTTQGQFADHLFAGDYAIHPTQASAGMLGSVWQWTASNYLAYPGFEAAPGALGEYNGKFMCNQHVLRGGSVATSSSHIRDTYRNFFPAHTRWQFAGLRLAKR